MSVSVLVNRVGSVLGTSEVASAALLRSAVVSSKSSIADAATELTCVVVLADIAGPVVAADDGRAGALVGALEDAGLADCLYCWRCNASAEPPTKTPIATGMARRRTRLRDSAAPLFTGSVATARTACFACGPSVVIPTAELLTDAACSASARPKSGQLAKRSVGSLARATGQRRVERRKFGAIAGH